jgi:mannose-6-phosphate isomerase-like protein (cupin superfamily)
MSNDAPGKAIVTRDGEGEANEAFGLRRVFRVTSDQTGGAFALFEENIPEGAGPPLHIHHREIETFIVLDGAVRFRAGDDEFVAGPGDIVTIPAGLPHTFQGRGPGPSRALVQLSPGHAAGFFPAVTDQGLDPSRDMERIVAVAAEYNLEFVGPPLD